MISVYLVLKTVIAVNSFLKAEEIRLAKMWKFEVKLILSECQKTGSCFLGRKVATIGCSRISQYQKQTNSSQKVKNETSTSNMIDER